jgi:hypothetical protein
VPWQSGDCLGFPFSSFGRPGAEELEGLPEPGVEVEDVPVELPGEPPNELVDPDEPPNELLDPDEPKPLLPEDPKPPPPEELKPSPNPEELVD